MRHEMNLAVFACISALAIFSFALLFEVLDQRRRIKELEHRAAAAESNDEIFWKVVDRFYRLEAQSGE